MPPAADDSARLSTGMHDGGILPETVGIRPANPGDIPWLIETCRIAYPEGFDGAAAQRWLNVRIGHPDIFIWRGQSALICAWIVQPFYAPTQSVCYVQFLASRETSGEPLPLLRESVQWAKAKGCAKWRLTNYRNIYDFAPLGRRLGAKLLPHTDWEMEIARG